MNLTAAQAQLELDRIVERIAAALEPEQIILFGSRARGEASDGSDVDLLVITSTGDSHELSKAAFKAARGRNISLDVIAVSRAYFDERLADGSVFFKSAMRDSKVVYAR